MVDKIKEFFMIGSGNSGLTEAFIYQNQPSSPENSVKVFSSSTQEKTSFRNVDKNAIFPDGKGLKVYFTEGIIIARNGKAGKMTFVDNTNMYCMNDHAYILYVKKMYKKKINIKYIMYCCKEVLEKCVTSDKKGNQTFNKTLFMESIIELPDIKTQERYVSEFEKMEKLLERLTLCIDKIDTVLSKIPYTAHATLEPVDKVFELISEDRNLIEEYIYAHQGKYPVYSAQIEGAFGYIDTYAYEGEILAIVQYGDSGKVTLRSGQLNIGRNCCGLIPRDEYADKVNLLYFKYALQNTFIENSKGESLKSLSQTTIKNTYFLLPKVEFQNEIASEFYELEKLKNRLQNIRNKINVIFE